MDLYVEAQLKSLNKQRRRERRKKREERFENKSFEEQLKERDQMKEQAQKKKINELIMTIKALELIGIDTSKERETLKQLLFSSKGQLL